MEQGELKDADIKRFVTAGNATFTILNEKTGVRFTFKVKKLKTKKDEKPSNGFYFVSIMTGANNEKSYTYMGVITGNAFKKTKGSQVHEDCKAYRAFDWLYRHLVNGNPFPPEFHFFHQGHCCRCGKALTVPESIKSGIGPECAKMM